METLETNTRKIYENHKNIKKNKSRLVCYSKTLPSTIVIYKMEDGSQQYCGKRIVPELEQKSQLYFLSTLSSKTNFE